MRDLILLRHAHAAHADGQADDSADIDRPLSPEGLAEATAAGHWLKDKGLLPARALCSPARRARDTLAAVVAVSGDIETTFADTIYEASAGTLAALVDQHRDVERLLLVGHNPGLERLAALMHSGQSGDYRGMPPGGIAVLRLPVDAAIEPGIATLSEFWWP